MNTAALIVGLIVAGITRLRRPTIARDDGPETRPPGRRRRRHQAGRPDLLQAHGYRVSVATGGDAMRAVLETADPVDVVVLDATMPGESSVALARHARDRGIRIVMISGNPDQMEAYQERADQLPWKSFTGAQLQRALEHALASEMAGQRPEDPD
jgi:CheY-like chemotaxis protein